MSIHSREVLTTRERRVTDSQATDLDQPDVSPDRIEVMYQAALAHGAVAA